MSKENKERNSTKCKLQFNKPSMLKLKCLNLMSMKEYLILSSKTTLMTLNASKICKYSGTSPGVPMSL